METINAIIVDDDELDRLIMMSYIKRIPNINLLGSFSCPIKALDFINKSSVDILFLDIDMPGLSGLDLLKKLTEIPACIFVTSHPEFAVESFELGILDFIVKPAKFDRFVKTMQRVDVFFEIKKKIQLFESNIGGDVIYIKEGHDQTKVKLHEIIYVEALKDYSLIVTAQRRHCVLSSIGNLLKETNFNSFIRVHRSYAVQKQYVQTVSTHELTLHNNVIIPIGRSYRHNISILL